MLSYYAAMLASTIKPVRFGIVAYNILYNDISGYVNSDTMDSERSMTCLNKLLGFTRWAKYDNTLTTFLHFPVDLIESRKDFFFVFYHYGWFHVNLCHKKVNNQNRERKRARAGVGFIDKEEKKQSCSKHAVALQGFFLTYTACIIIGFNENKGLNRERKRNRNTEKKKREKKRREEKCKDCRLSLLCEAALPPAIPLPLFPSLHLHFKQKAGS